MLKPKQQIQKWATELDLDHVKFTDTSLSADGEALQRWMDEGLHEPLNWLNDHGDMRWTPSSLMPGVETVISVRLHYLPEDVDLAAALKQESRAYVSRYALGRDYHKVLRRRLAKLAKQINQAFPGTESRALVDSAPVLERALARKAGHGWVGKNTMMINPEEGSYFFLGEIYTTLKIEPDTPDDQDRCNDCDACLKVCPTAAFVAPYKLETKRCISYLTIENDGPIPVEFREPIGNRVFGCDDCQVICPFNKYPKTAKLDDFQPRNNLDTAELLDLFELSEEEFLARTEGSPLRRAGYHNFLRNVSVGLGNSPRSDAVINALQLRLSENLSEMLNEHIEWALKRQYDPTRRRRKLRR
ncbi:MAG: tRNA epoxyqueuosine(34) reductase QueG [Gammaproteobacteria bacterium]|nr:tRNA epoxyqueuosine(34) reductase QueG [Gammaproteobacteria bacterium]